MPDKQSADPHRSTSFDLVVLAVIGIEMDRLLREMDPDWDLRAFCVGQIRDEIDDEATPVVTRLVRIAAIAVATLEALKSVGVEIPGPRLAPPVARE